MCKAHGTESSPVSQNDFADVVIENISTTREDKQQPELDASGPLRLLTSASKRKSRFCLFQAMRDDLERRLPHYRSDWIDGLQAKVVSSSLFMFFTSIAPAITFAAVLNGSTKEDGVSQIGPVEVLLSTALTGTIFAIFGGQPLCIVGVTGPVTIFTLACFTVAQSLSYPFLPFFCWVQMWAALMHMILAATGACSAVKLVTRFSCETFGMLIAVIYLFTGAKNLIGYFMDKSSGAALLSVLLGLGTAWSALSLSAARGWSTFSRGVRVTIADYAAFTAVSVFCLLPYVGNLADLTPSGCDGCHANETITTLEVPASFGPTAAGRSWIVNPGALSASGVMTAIPLAFFLTVLFFFDHNVSSILCQAPEFGLKKGSAYHWDFFVIGVQILVTGLLGLPPVNGLIPQAPLHTDSLCEKEFRTDASGRKVEVIVKCHEQRVSNLAQAVLIGATLAIISLVGYLPIAALDGLFLYMGIASFGGNSFYSRMVLFLTDKERRHARHLPFVGHSDGVDGAVPMRVIRRFTLMQMGILAAIFVVTRLPFIDGFFPLLIAVLVPVRMYLLPRVFGAAHVDAMDSEGDAPEELPSATESNRSGAK